jgi:hypothetical protein
MIRRKPRKAPQQSYIDKYGPKEGAIIYRLKQTNAANARWKAHYRERLSAVSKPSPNR